ncbi:hypothetical protein ABZ567_28095 [Streptomyces sp. NPDC016459]|uniref:hypothetical protein n=1 Tax=Streptomyces sp. NPDC016459 TaxID=3157190 RepID=UPI0033CD3377
MVEDTAEAVAERVAGEAPGAGDTGPGREVCWRGRTVAFASLDVDDAELVHA